MKKYDAIDKFNSFFSDVSVTPGQVNDYLQSAGTNTLDSRRKISDLVSRPQVSLKEICKFVPRGTFLRYNIDFESLLVPYECFDTGVGQAVNDRPVSDGSLVGEAGNLRKFSEEMVSVDGLDFYCASDKVKAAYTDEILESCEISIKYKGYIERERRIADKIMRLENLEIPEDFDFDKVNSLSIECRQKLKKYSPRTIAQASRISGVSPADISVLLVYFGR